MMTAVAERSPGFGPDDYDAVERAVMETPRGRWFLAERDKRQRSAETQRILDALKKLEGVLAAAPAQPVSGVEVLRAIAAQRAASERNAPSEPNGATAADLTSASAETVAQALSMRNLKYFKQDEAVFTPAEPAAPKLAVVEAAKPAEAPKTGEASNPVVAVAKGARLIVSRVFPATSGTPSPTEAPAAVTTPAPVQPAPAEAPMPAAAVKAPEPVNSPAPAAAASGDKRRIVIIRRTAAEPMDVPLQAELAASPSP